MIHASPSKFHTQISLLSEKTTIVPGESFDVGVVLEMAEGWHTYYREPGDSGQATSIEWKLPKGFEAGPIRWPKPETFKDGALVTHGYTGDIMLLVAIKAPTQGLKTGEAVRLEAGVEWLECATLCIPGSGKVSTEIRIESQSINASDGILSQFQTARSRLETIAVPPDHPPSTLPHPSSFILHPSLPQMLLYAFLGGLILNVMPCVLPILALKAVGFVKQADKNRAAVRREGMVYTLGVLVSLWILAILMISLKALWGFQQQSPTFLMVMILLVTATSLNLFGVFEVELGATALTGASRLASREGDLGAFFGGMFATVLATPCTAPILGVAMGYALSQPAPVILAMFTAVGVGLSLPYLVLSWQPWLLGWLPKPGAWMTRFKQAMGFAMLGAAGWLLWILSAHSVPATFDFLGWVMGTAFLIWLVSVILPGRFVPILIAVIAMACVSRFFMLRVIERESVAGPVVKPSGDLIAWQPYSKDALQSALKTAQPVFIDFTARWCTTCQANRISSIEVEKVAARLKELKVIPLLADWTKPDEAITEALRSYGRAGVPLYVVYPSDRSKPPILLPELLTPQIVLDALDAAAAGK